MVSSVGANASDKLLSEKMSVSVQTEWSRSLCDSASNT